MCERGEVIARLVKQMQEQETGYGYCVQASLRDNHQHPADSIRGETDEAFRASLSPDELEALLELRKDLGV